MVTKKRSTGVVGQKKKGRRGPSETNRSQGSARDDEPRQRASCVSCSDVAGPDLLFNFF